MFGRPIELFKILGFAIRIDASWFLLAFVITWSLAKQAFPAQYPGLPPETYWAMGVAGALGLFFSIVFHELAHSLVARRFDLQMRGITLFIFGGVAEMVDEPPSPKAEFWVAIAGPVASLVIGLGCFGVAGLEAAASWPVALTGVISYLGLINLMLVLFNLVPAFPLDGGRVLRSLLWQWKGNLRWATRITSAIGSGFGILLIVLGVVALFSGNFVGGLWWFLIGMFLRNAAQMSYQQLLLRRILEGEPVRRFMQTNPITVERSISIAELVRDYVYRHHFKMYPVVDDSRLLGCVTTRRIKELPPEEWERQTVGTITEPCVDTNSVGPDDDALEALAKMRQIGASRLLVVDQGRLVGILTLKDLLEFFSLKVELEPATA